jgi:hypothetical protein
VADQHIVGGGLYPVFINETLDKEYITQGGYYNDAATAVSSSGPLGNFLLLMLP